MHMNHLLSLLVLSPLLVNGAAYRRYTEDDKLDSIVVVLDQMGVLEKVDNMSPENLQKKLKQLNLDNLVDHVHLSDKYQRLETKINQLEWTKIHKKQGGNSNATSAGGNTQVFTTTQVLSSDGKAVTTQVLVSQGGNIITLDPSGTLTSFAGASYTVALPSAAQKSADSSKDAKQSASSSASSSAASSSNSNAAAGIQIPGLLSRSSMLQGSVLLGGMIAGIMLVM